MNIITSKDNTSIKEYVKLAKSKSYRDQTKRFVIEGVKLINEAFESHVRFEMIFITQECLEKNRKLEKKLSQTDCGTIITQEVSEKMAQQNTPQGVFAICIKLDNRLCADTIYHNGRFLMLCELQDAGNVGTILRTAEAIGIDGVVITKGNCDIYSLKALRGSMGAVFRIPVLTVDDSTDFLVDMRKNGVKTYASVVDKNAQPLKCTVFSNPALLLIGNEGNGLEQDIIELCSDKITIEMLGNAESLNASMAACILMWEMVKN